MAGDIKFKALSGAFLDRMWKALGGTPAGLDAAAVAAALRKKGATNESAVAAITKRVMAGDGSVDNVKDGRISREELALSGLVLGMELELVDYEDAVLSDGSRDKAAFVRMGTISPKIREWDEGASPGLVTRDEFVERAIPPGCSIALDGATCAALGNVVHQLLTPSGKSGFTVQDIYGTFDQLLNDYRDGRGEKPPRGQ